jgi:hypothetical protein
MSDFKVEDLSPVPFFAHFLEGQFAKDMTQEQMKAIRGGAVMTTTNSYDDGELPDPQQLLNELLHGQFPGMPFPFPGPITHPGGTNPNGLDNFSN